MSLKSKIQLKTSCILSVPFKVYEEDFSFIVNNREFKTSRVISDLLSPKISKMHLNDPTISTFTIDTKQQGDFSHILQLLNFNENELPEDELPFVIEVLNLLGNDSVNILDFNQPTEITKDNIFQLIQYHERYSQFNQKQFQDDITFISSHFFELCDTHLDDMKKLQVETVFAIISNESLQIDDEDQLLKFVNDLYRHDVKYSILYDTIYFRNVTSKMIVEFAELFDIEYMTRDTWKRLTERLSQDVECRQEEGEEGDVRKYRKKSEKKVGMNFSKEENGEFSGIINYLRTKSSNKIENEINFTASSVVDSNSCYQPANVALFEDRNNGFESNNQPNDWICLDFKEHRVIPTGYTIRSTNWSGENWHHLKSWTVEGSIDNSSWSPLDSQSNCSYLNGSGKFHTFGIQNEQSKEFRYIRIRSTGPNWGNSNYLIVDSIEVYGTLI